VGLVRGGVVLHRAALRVRGYRLGVLGRLRGLRLLLLEALELFLQLGGFLAVGVRLAEQRLLARRRGGRSRRERGNVLLVGDVRDVGLVSGRAAALGAPAAAAG